VEGSTLRVSIDRSYLWYMVTQSGLGVSCS